MRVSPEYENYLKSSLKSRPPVIKQIKGKGNAKPHKDYIPFVQDFVKSGKWSDIDDVIYRVLDYMKDCGWKPSYVIVDSESTNIENRDATEYLKNRFRFGTFGREISPVFSGLQIDFIRI